MILCTLVHCFIDKVKEGVNQATASASNVMNNVSEWTAGAVNNTFQRTGSVIADVKELPVNAKKKALTWTQTAVSNVSSWVLQPIMPAVEKQLGYVTFGIIGVVVVICIVIILFVGVKFFSRLKVQSAYQKL